MVKSLQILCIFLAVILPATSSAQQTKSPEQLKMMLQNTGQDSNRVKLLLELGSYYLFKPEELKPDLDSALSFLLAAKELCGRLKDEKQTTKTMWLLSRCYFEREEVPSGRDAFMQIVQTIQKKGDKAEEASAWMRMAGRMFRSVNTYDEIIYYFRQAIPLYQQLGDKENAIVALKEIADTHLNQGKLDESEKELLEVVEQYKAIGYPNLHYSYDLLAAVSTLKGNMNRALYFGLEMMKSMKATGDSASANYFYYRMGRIYDELGQPQESVEWYKKAFVKNGGVDYDICLIIVRTLTKIGQGKEALDFVNDCVRRSPPADTREKSYVANALGDCYNALQQYDLAEKYYLEMIRSEKLLKKKNHNTSTVNFTIGEFYVHRHRYPAAEPYLHAVLALPSGIVTTKRLRDTYHLLFKVDSAQGDYLSAIRYFQRHKLLNDSIFNETKSRQIEELQIQYATENKENELKALQQEKILQQSALQQANLTKNITFGTGTLLLVILGLLYNRFRLKQRVNRQLETQQIEINQTNHALQKLLEDKERLLREIHHRVKNNLQIVMSLLNSQSVYLENDTALTAIRDSQQRIHSISLIHQKLYQSENVAMIDISDYIRELVEYLQGSYDTGQNILFDLQTEHIELDVTQAVPVGLILNEAISNAVKYAFPGGKTGTVTISLQQIDDAHFVLKVADNGTGLPEDFDPNKVNSLGMSLMRGLSKQLHGSFELKNDKGLTVVVTFEKERIAVEEEHVYETSKVS